jgi:diguanylate cyclase (GGDEF)-like protein
MSNQNDNTPAMPRPPEDDEPRVPHLVALNGPEVGGVFRLTAPESIVGASSAADIRLTHPTISRRHAVVRLRDDGTVWIDDLGSTNGTFIGIDRVHEATVVPDGSNVGFGTFALVRLTYSPVASAALGRLANTRARMNTRNFLLDLLRAEHAYARRHGTPLAVVFIRADALSSVGPAGSVIRDDAMGIVGTEIDSAIRTEDFLARSGPDEFVILARGSADDALNLAERLRARIESRAAAPGSTLAFHTITAVVMPIRAVGLRMASGTGGGPVTAEDILSTARALAGPTFQGQTNAVLCLQPLVI